MQYNYSWICQTHVAYNSVCGILLQDGIIMDMIISKIADTDLVIISKAGKSCLMIITWSIAILSILSR